MSTLDPASGTLNEKAPASVTTGDDEKTMNNSAVIEGTEGTLASTVPSASRDPGASSNGEHKPAKSTETTTQTAPSQLSPSAMPSSRQSPPRKSGWKLLIAKLVPCISPSKAHPDAIEDSKPQRDSTSTETAPAKNNADVVREAPSSPTPVTTTTTPAPATPTKPAPITTASSAVQTEQLDPPPVAQAEVVIPPSPTHHLLPTSETAGLTSGAVQPPGSTGREEEDESQVASSDDDGDAQDGLEGTVPEEEDEDAIVLRGGLGIPIVNGVATPLLPPVKPEHVGRKCLVLDLDETLLHSSFKLIPQCDYVVPVEIEWQWHNVYVIKRPGVDQFLKKMGELFEIVVFTASLSKYADPVLDKLDIHKVVSHRLFRESCYNHKGNYVKDLSQLGRPLTETIILDNSPASYIFHPNNAVPVSSWFNDPHDTELTDLCPFLTDLRLVDDIRGVLDGGI